MECSASPEPCTGVPRKIYRIAPLPSPAAYIDFDCNSNRIPALRRFGNRQVYFRGVLVDIKIFTFFFNSSRICLPSERALDEREELHLAIHHELIESVCPQ